MLVYQLTVDQLSAVRQFGSLDPCRIYEVIDTTEAQFGWSPDGDGMYWYRSLAELDAEHGVTL